MLLHLQKIYNKFQTFWKRSSIFQVQHRSKPKQWKTMVKIYIPSSWPSILTSVRSVHRLQENNEIFIYSISTPGAISHASLSLHHVCGNLLRWRQKRFRFSLVYFRFLLGLESSTMVWMWQIIAVMELLMTESHYILQDGEYSLWCSRSDGTLVPKDGKFFADCC
jgi:hypothetical protein